MINMVSVIDKKIIDVNISKFQFNDAKSCISTNVQWGDYISWALKRSCGTQNGKTTENSCEVKVNIYETI